jgi:hypothetical protein
MMSFTTLWQKIEVALPQAEKVNSVISDRGVDWHLEHTLKIIIAISDTLGKSNPAEFKPTFGFWKIVILWSGHIPRGRSKSPKPFNNLDQVNVAELPDLLAKAKSALSRLDTLPSNSFFKHPVFGHLDLLQAKRFILIHSNHHLTIVEDIIGE